MPPAAHDIGPSTSFRRRLFLIFGGFTLGIACTFTAIDLIEDIEIIKDHAAEKAQLLASQLAASARLSLFADDRPTLGRLAAEFAANPDVRTVVITNLRGQVLAQGGQPLATTVDTIHRKADIIPLGSGQGAAQALGLTTEENSTLGSVWVVMDNEVQRQVINRQIASALGTALLFWLAFTYVGVLIVRWVSKALAPLIDGLRTIQTGDFSVSIPPSRYAELAVATAAVNELAVALQFRDEENRRLQQELLDAMKNEVREERRQLMAKLIQTNRMTSLGLLTSSMAHEINTPNGAIKLAGQQVARVWADAVPILDRVAAEEGDFILGGAEFSVVRQEVGRGLEIIGRSAERINQVINDLRAYSIGEQNPLTDRVCLNQVLTDALAIVMAHGKQGNISIERQLRQDLPRVTGNRYHLGQVFTNLLLNGIQAVPPERPGSLVITTGYDPACRLVQVTVQDNGEGIADDIRNHLLEPFFTTRLDAGGSGLGLYIAHFIITNHNGALTFDSQSGGGTTVTVSIPAAADS